MKNLFVADYFKNEVTGDITEEIGAVKRWLQEGQKVVCRMRELSSYFEFEVDFEVEDVVVQDGVYVKVASYLFPFIGFTSNVHILRTWKISEVVEGKISRPYIRDVAEAKRRLKEGKVLVYVFEDGHTSYITSFESMEGVDFFIAHSGGKYILEPLKPSIRFNRAGVLKWPSERT